MIIAFLPLCSKTSTVVFSFLVYYFSLILLLFAPCKLPFVGFCRFRELNCAFFFRSVSQIVFQTSLGHECTTRYLPLDFGEELVWIGLERDGIIRRFNCKSAKGAQRKKEKKNALFFL